MCWFSLGSGGVGATPGGVFWGCDGAVLQVEALQEVLEKLKSKRVPHYEKKFGQVPMVSAPVGGGGTGRPPGCSR